MYSKRNVKYGGVWLFVADLEGGGGNMRGGHDEEVYMRNICRMAVVC